MCKYFKPLSCLHYGQFSYLQSGLVISSMHNTKDHSKKQALLRKASLNNLTCLAFVFNLSHKHGYFKTSNNFSIIMLINLKHLLINNHSHDISHFPYSKQGYSCKTFQKLISITMNQGFSNNTFFVIYELN